MMWALVLGCGPGPMETGDEVSPPLPPGCGNGVVDEGEVCDDGNDVDTDDCLSSCVRPTCGDGIVHAGVEVCDDANADFTDACVQCMDARCGDGFVQAGVETCDAGQNNGTPLGGCFPDCTPVPERSLIPFRIEVDPSGLGVEQPVEAVAGDLNGDGVDDLLVRSVGFDGDDRGTLTVLTNDGTGRLVAPSIGRDRNLRPRSIGVADIDQDGFAEVVTVTDQSGGRVYTHSGSAGGVARTAWSERTDGGLGFDGGHEPIDVVLVDIDEDGTPDAVALNRDPPGLAILKGRALFGDVSYLGTLPFPGEARGPISVADIDGDGHDDVVACNADGAPVVFRGTGTELLPAVTAATAVSVRTLVGFDLDQDGDDELLGQQATQLGTAATVSVFDWDGAALVEQPSLTLQSAGTECLPATTIPTVPARADVDGDGRVDVLWPCGIRRTLLTTHGVPGDPVHTFLRCDDCAPADLVPVPRETAGLALADVDADGAVDAVLSLRQGEVAIFWSDGSRPVEPPTRFLTGSFTDSTPRPTQRVGVGDVTGDGQPDLTFINQAGSVVTIHQVSPRQFVNPAVAASRLTGVLVLEGEAAPSPLLGVGPDPFTSNDLTAHLYTGRITDGQIDLTAEPAPLGVTPARPAFLDTNADAVDDLVFLSGAQDVVVLFREKDGSLLDTAREPMFGPTTDLIVADVTGDGLVDLVTPLFDGTHEVAVRPADIKSALGTFPLSRDTPLVGPVIGVGDVDGDGAGDLLVGRPDGRIVRYPSTRDGGFAAPVEVGVPDAPARTGLVADLDDDGRLDLVWLSSTEVHLWQGLGNGEFVPAGTVPTGIDPVDLELADLDGEGLPEIVVVDRGSDDVVVVQIR